MSETQLDRILSALQAQAWLTLVELAEITKSPVASVSAQIRNLRKEEHGGHTINRRRRRGNLFEYNLSDGDEQQ